MVVRMSARVLYCVLCCNRVSQRCYLDEYRILHSNQPNMFHDSMCTARAFWFASAPRHCPEFGHASFRALTM